MTIKTNGRTIYYDECASGTRFFVLDDFEPQSFATLEEAKNYAAKPLPATYEVPEWQRCRLEDM